MVEFALSIASWGNSPHLFSPPFFGPQWGFATGSQVSVSDTGSGISEGDITKAFTPFFTTKADGTVLGLALSQQIVVENDGRLSCNSAEGIGTTFSISFINLSLAEGSSSWSMTIK